MSGTQIQLADCFLPVGSLDAYIIRVNNIPMLSAQEEHDLAVRFREKNDLEAARKLVLSHLRFVVKIARGYIGYGLPQGDLIQEGNIGLMKAVKRFDPNYGVRLVSFAVHWIKAEMHEFILKNWRIVKIATTKAQRKLFFNLRSAKSRLGWLTKEEVDDVAKTLNVTTANVLEMEARLYNHDSAFDITQTEDENQYDPANFLTADAQHNPAESFENADWDNSQVSKLQTALAKLDDRSQEILQARWLGDKKATLQTLADKFKVSAERVRQLENQAMDKLKLHLQEAI